MKETAVVMDASVLINFAWIGRMDLFKSLHGFVFWVPTGVVNEVIRPEQSLMLQAAFDGEALRAAETSPEEILIARKIRREYRLGIGESLCLALARERDGWIACDEESNRFLTAVQELLGSGRRVNSSGIVSLALQQGSLTLSEADAFIEVWKRNSYQVDFGSFRELMGRSGSGDGVAEEESWMEYGSALQPNSAVAGLR